MAPFLELEPAAHRRSATTLTHADHAPAAPLEDARAGQMFRGLLYGLPLGLVMWLFLALLLWHLT